jgi:hypothetical protein
MQQFGSGTLSGEDATPNKDIELPFIACPNYTEDRLYGHKLFLAPGRVADRGSEKLQGDSRNRFMPIELHCLISICVLIQGTL